MQLSEKATKIKNLTERLKTLVDRKTRYELLLDDINTSLSNSQRELNDILFTLKDDASESD